MNESGEMVERGEIVERGEMVERGEGQLLKGSHYLNLLKLNSLSIAPSSSSFDNQRLT